MLDRATKAVILKQCEAIIAEGLEAMDKVDRALTIIHDMELFTEEFDNFSSYCQAKWYIGDKHNYVFIDSKQTRNVLPFPQNNITRRIYESRQQVSNTTK